MGLFYAAFVFYHCRSGWNDNCISDSAVNYEKRCKICDCFILYYRWCSIHFIWIFIFYGNVSGYDLFCLWFCVCIQFSGNRSGHCKMVPEKTWNRYGICDCVYATGISYIPVSVKLADRYLRFSEWYRNYRYYDNRFRHHWYVLY